MTIQLNRSFGCGHAVPWIPTDKQGQKVNTQETSHLASQSVKDSNNKPKVSVIMNCFNGEKYLSEAIDSVYEQTYKDWEIIFWDNGSTDNSAEIAKSYDNRIRYFRSEKNCPNVGKVRNLAYEQVRGEYVALLDVDDIWLPDKLEKQVRLFEENKNLGLVFSNTIVFYDDGVEYELFKFTKPKRGYVFGGLLMNNFITTVSMVYKRSALESLEYVFDDEFTYIHDYDLSLRVVRKYETDFIDEPLAKLRKHGANLGDKILSILPQENSKLLEKLIVNMPEIREKFSEEIRCFKKQTNLFFAFSEWKKGNKILSAKYLKPYLNDKKFFVTFVLIFFFSYSRYENLKSKLKYLVRKLK